MNRLLIYLCLLTCAAIVVLGATAGPSDCGTAADDATVGTFAWSSPTNGCGGEGLTTNTGTLTGAPATTTHYLKATSFGFSVPAGATLNSVTLTVKKCFNTVSSVTTYGVDSSVRLVNSGVIGTVNKADTVTHWKKCSIGYDTTNYVFSGADLESMTATQLNASTSGGAFSGVINDPIDDEDGVMRIDNVTITVDYTLSGPTNAQRSAGFWGIT